MRFPPPSRSDEGARVRRYEPLGSRRDNGGTRRFAQALKLVSPNPRTFVGSGKAEEIASLCLAHAADVVIFDEELTPAQQGNLEKIMPQNVKVIDRTALILDIFAAKMSGDIERFPTLRLRMRSIGGARGML